MPTPYYQRQDAVNVLYDGTALTADGNSTALSFDVAGGLPPSEIVIKTGDMEGTGTITFIIQDNATGSFVSTPYQLVLPAAANATYVWPVDNRMILGTSIRLLHDITAGTDADGVQVWGHLRPSTLHTM